jgi:hypothetical protein
MLTSLVTTAPVLFDHPGSALDFWVPGLLMVSAIAAVLGLTFGVPTDEGLHPLTRVALLILAAAGLVGAFLCISHLAASNNEYVDSKNAYAASVSDWLADDYGIDTNKAAVKKLIADESLTAEYDGRQVVISLGETTTGTLSVVDENRTVLEPLAD